MADRLPEFSQGSRWRDVTAAELQSLVNAVKRRVSVSVGPGLAVEDTPAGLRISLAGTGSLKSPRERVVVLVRKPRVTCTSLLVREVQYANSPPKQGDYGWAGPAFEAYPDIGHTAVDYVAFYWDVEAHGIPTLDARYLTAQKRHGTWTVKQPPRTGGAVVVRDIVDDGLTWLYVERVILIVDDNNVAQWVGVGDWEEMFTFCMCPAGLFRPMLLPEGNPARMGDVLDIRVVDGIEQVYPFKPRWHTTIRGDEPHAGCRPVGP